MNTMKKSLPFFIFCFSFIHAGLFAQGNEALNKKIYKADKYYKIKNYSEALPLYEEVLESGVKHPTVYYKAGMCYKQSRDINERIKSIPYFEKALASNDKNLPPVLEGYLGDEYLENGQIKKAIDTYTSLKGKIEKGARGDKEEVERNIEVGLNALAMMSSARDIEVNRLGANVNTKSTEYNPVISADETVIAFTALRPNRGKTRPGDKFIEEIYFAYNESGAWSVPEKIEIRSNFNVGTAGLSADGQEMLIFIGGENHTGNLHSIKKNGLKWSETTILGEHVNSRYLETTASLSPDGKVIYFASNRPGGYGGMDIYRVERSGDTWGKPKNLGPLINTKYDEDAPFIHPDRRTLFFTSNGHNTMGGRDIFKSVNSGGKWQQPLNMGYPINTTADDDYFTLTADGTKGYFSSDRKGGSGGQDIYSVEMPKDGLNVALTMIKGRILDGETLKPIKTKIYVIDNETKKKLDFVYHPNSETGDYLIILPPNKNYDMIIESDDFLPYTLNINVPNQNYFYELYQQIRLKTIKHFDVKVGQEVEVKNAFFDTHADAKSSLKKSHESQLIRSDSIDVYDLMNDLIAAGDQEGIDYILDLLYTSNPIDDINFDNTEDVEIANRIYYYDESDESKFEKKKIDGKVIFSLPTMFVAEEAKRLKNKVVSKKGYDHGLLKPVVKVYFDVGKSDLKKQYVPDLDKILTSLKKHDNLGVEISGYASSDGNAEDNRELSNKRAISVLDYINRKGIVRRRIVAKGFGAAQGQNVSKEEARRVEIRIVDLEAPLVK